MHIPDGYLSPDTSGFFYLVSAPLWWLSLRSMRRHLRERHVSLLAILAAFSFLIMMFNIPLPGGTTGHAVGGVLIAILVGPWPAMIAVTLALVIQALFFGDGGILALGANAFNMGFIMPTGGYLAFRAVAGDSAPPSRRFVAAAAIGGYLGLNLAALAAALELGVQPALHHLPDGTPLYCPFTVAVTVPAMMIPHLTIGGAAEALLTGGVVAFLGRYHREIFTRRPAFAGPPPGPGNGTRDR
jgi:cobalt/nickel transport system permease protein